MSPSLVKLTVYFTTCRVERYYGLRILRNIETVSYEYYLKITHLQGI